MCGQKDFSSYYENGNTLKILSHQASLIYFSLEKAALAATECIKKRVVPGVGKNCDLIRPMPEVVGLLKT